MTAWSGARLARLPTLPALVAVGSAATIAVGLATEAGGGNLGTGLPPFFATWDPRLGGYAVLAATALIGAVLLAPWILGLPARAFVLAAAVLSLGLRLVLATVEDGPSAWWSVFGSDPEAQNEYLPALPALDPGAGAFLDHFAEIAPTLPVHPSAHPPGMLLLLDGLGIDSAKGMAALVVGAGVLSIPLVYAIARALLDEPRARIAALLSCFAPAVLLYGATSADALFMTLGLASAAALVARRAAVRAAGAVLLLVASFFSYALLAIAAWATLAVWMRDGRAAALRLAAWCALAVCGGYALLYAITGFDVMGALASADDSYRAGIATVRPYAYWLFGSPVAFLVAAGLPVAWFACRALAEHRDAAVALAVVVATAAVLGFTKAETERIWLFLVPLLCVAAAAVMPRERLTQVLSLLAAQALAVEVLLETVW